MEDFRRIFPGPPHKLYFDGGLNNKFEKTLIGDNEASDCRNVIFQNGSVATRGGTTILNTASVGAFAFDGIYTRQDRSGAETMIVFGGGSVYALNATTFVTIPSAQSVFTAGFRVGTAQTENYLFMGNGSVNPYKWDGINFTQHGIYAPTTAVTIAGSISTGPLSGIYVYRMTYLNAQGVESNGSPSSDPYSSTSAILSLTLPIAPVSAGVTSRRLYRTYGNATSTAASSFNFVAPINDNTTIAYADLFPDSNMDNTIHPPTDNHGPPRYSLAVWHGGVQRMFAFTPSSPGFLLYSDIGNPFNFPSANFMAFGDAGMDIVTGMIEIENGLFVTCRRRSYLVYFADNALDIWYTTQCRSTYGSSSPFALVPYENGVFIPATENGELVGFAHMVGANTGRDIAYLSTGNFQSDLISSRIEPYVFNINNTYISGMSAIAFKNKIYVSLPYGTNQTTNNQCLVMDYSYDRMTKGKIHSWCPWDGMHPVQFCIYNGKLYYASADATGFVYEMNTNNYNDNGAAINSYFSTKSYSGYEKESVFHKDFRYLSPLVDQAGQYFMNINALIDSDLGVGTNFPVDLSTTVDLWGVFAWDAFTWGSGDAQLEERVDLGGINGRRIQFTFSNMNMVNQRFKVHSMNFIYNLKGFR